MVSIKEVEQISRRFVDQEFFNTNYMSVEITRANELVVHLLKNIRTDNLPLAFEGLRVSYKFAGKR